MEKAGQADQIVLTVGYDIDNLKIPEIADHYRGEITVDRYGRRCAYAHGTETLMYDCVSQQDYRDNNGII